jgi:transposase
MSTISRKPYPSDVSDDEWAFVAPYLTLLREDAAQRHHELREVFNALRWLVRTGAPWRLLPHALPPWEAVYQQTQRWLAAGCFEALVHDLRTLLRKDQRMGAVKYRCPKFERHGHFGQFHGLGYTALLPVLQAAGSRRA